MKMKIFRGTDLGVLEQAINEWPQTELIRNIHHVTHTNNGGTMFITVW